MLWLGVCAAGGATPQRAQARDATRAKYMFSVALMILIADSASDSPYLYGFIGEYGEIQAEKAMEKRVVSAGLPGKLAGAQRIELGAPVLA